MAQVKERGGVGKEGRILPSPPPPLLSFFGSRFISRAVKTEYPLPRSFFAPKLNGNACYAGYKVIGIADDFLYPSNSKVY